MLSKALVIASVVLLTGCGTITGKDMIKGANLAKNIAGLSKAGVTEELIVATKDAIDPMRGGGID
jgi:hypothetical protein